MSAFSVKQDVVVVVGSLDGGITATLDESCDVKTSVDLCLHLRFSFFFFGIDINTHVYENFSLQKWL